jgi:T5orf172 domain
MTDVLTTEELGFLRRHGLGPGDVFDARGMHSASWKRRIREEGKEIALGTRCAAAGHRLRTRAGHCVQCDPKKLSYQQRYSAKQYVYIAVSSANNLIKIGTCVDCDQREKQLRAERYGNCGDWRMVDYVHVENAGEVEHRARSLLSEYAVVRSYVKDGVYQDGIELLKCTSEQALEALRAVIERMKQD